MGTTKSGVKCEVIKVYCEDCMSVALDSKEYIVDPIYFDLDVVTLRKRKLKKL